MKAQILKIAGVKNEKEFYKKFPTEEAFLKKHGKELKKAQKRTSPMQAIKNFCNDCVGGIRTDITNCTAKQCSLYIYRPYKKGDDNE